MVTVEKVTTNIKAPMLTLITDHIGDTYTHFGLGTNAVAADESDTALGTEIDINADASKTRHEFYRTETDTGAGTVKCFGSVQSTEGNTNDITEYGEFDSDAGGSDGMCTRCTFTALTKNEDVALHIETTKTITITLNV